MFNVPTSEGGALETGWPVTAIGDSKIEIGLSHNRLCVWIVENHERI